MRTRFLASLALLILFFVASGARADGFDVALPLHNGKIELSDLSSTVCRELHLRSFPLGRGSVNVKGIVGSLFVQSLNAALGDGCRLSVEGDKLLLHLDPSRLPHSIPQAQLAVRNFAATASPDATARQQKLYGLFLPGQLDASRPVVILIHGLHDGMGTMQSLGNDLSIAGYQVGYFVYPAAGPINDDAASFAKHIKELQQVDPQIEIDLVGYSMGGLVARRYVEGPDYAGNVDHLILVGTPNHGSDWAWAGPVLAVGAHYRMARYEPGWSASWFFTDGMGEADRDLSPGSKFLRHLNAFPRRAGVHYTIVAGNKNLLARLTANMVGNAAGEVPGRSWFSQSLRSGLQNAGTLLNSATAPGDGPVSLHSAALAGVTDVVVVPTDHIGLCQSVGGKPPAALAIIENRMGR